MLTLRLAAGDMSKLCGYGDRSCGIPLSHATRLSWDSLPGVITPGAHEKCTASYACLQLTIMASEEPAKYYANPECLQQMLINVRVRLQFGVF